MSGPLSGSTANDESAAQAQVSGTLDSASSEAVHHGVHQSIVNAESGPALMGNDHEIETMNFPFDENIFDSTPAAPAGSEEVPYIEPSPEDSIQPPDFKPFFTLIEDSETGAHHHPSVHYIFSDDDPEILTSALLDTFDDATQDETEPGSPPRRSVIVDVASDGKTIKSAVSLSPEWQALETMVGPAPSWGSDVGAAERGLMLRISGQQNGENSEIKWSAREQRDYASVEDLLQTFSERLARLDKTLNRTVDRPKES